MKKYKIYLAGPDVFVPNCIELLANKKKELCEKYGFDGQFPLDNTLDLNGKTPKEKGLAISKANENMIRNCDIVVANLTPFRGVSADPGTVYEVGVGCALNKIVYGYSNNPKPFDLRTREYYSIAEKGSRISSKSMETGISHAPTNSGAETYSHSTLESPFGVEKFDLPDNLMIPGGIYQSGGEFFVGECPKNQEMLYLGHFEKCLSDLRQKINSGKILL